MSAYREGDRVLIHGTIRRSNLAPPHGPLHAVPNGHSPEDTQPDPGVPVADLRRECVLGAKRCTEPPISADEENEYWELRHAREKANEYTCDTCGAKATRWLYMGPNPDDLSYVGGLCDDCNDVLSPQTTEGEAGPKRRASGFGIACFTAGEWNKNIQQMKKYFAAARGMRDAALADGEHQTTSEARVRELEAMLERFCRTCDEYARDAASAEVERDSFKAENKRLREIGIRDPAVARLCVAVHGRAAYPRDWPGVIGMAADAIGELEQSNAALRHERDKLAEKIEHLNLDTSALWERVKAMERER